MDFSKDYQIHYYHCDTKLICNIYSIIRIFEDIAIQQSEDLGVGVDYYHKNKVGWMLTRWAIEINELPKFRDKITVITTPKAFNNFYANRWYRVLDSEGKQISSINKMDGVRLNYDDGWILIRRSGTSPYLRLSGESSVSLDESKKINVLAEEVVKKLELI